MNMKFSSVIWILSLLLMAVMAVACQTTTPTPPATDTVISGEVTVIPEPPQETNTLGEGSAFAETMAETLPQTTQKAQETEENEMKVIYETVQNPIHDGGGDPWVWLHEGNYYYCYSRGNGVSVAKMSSLHTLKPMGTTVYTAPKDTMYSAEYWAPELHYINGEWYIYVAADDGNNHNHRMYVLKGTSQNPRDPFEMVGQITDPSNKWAIDGSVLQLNGELYFVWSGWKGDVNVAQNIYIAHMSDPCTIDSERVCISVPEYTWERQGEPYVNEGPTILQHDGQTFLVYSASGSWTDDYCLGMLTLSGDDPLNPDHWVKQKRPVFKMKRGVCYGPGHASFTTAVDGSVWMIFHGNLVSGSGWNGRSVWLAPVMFDENGKPDFGEPQASVEFPVGVLTP